MDPNEDAVPLLPSPGEQAGYSVGSEAASDDELIDAVVYPTFSQHNVEDWNELQRGDSFNDGSFYEEVGTDSDDELILTESHEEPIHVNWYAWILGRYPYTVSLFVLAIMVATFLLSWFYHPPTNFGNPTEGFETRGTPISTSAITHRHIMEAIKNHHLFVSPPVDTPPPPIGTTKHQNPVVTVTVPPKQPELAKPCKNYGGDLAFESVSGGNLFTLDALKAMCSIEDQYVTPYLNTSLYRRYGLPYIVGQLVGKPCHQITPQDFERVQRNLYYFSQCQGDTNCYKRLCERAGKMQNIHPDCPQISTYISDMFGKYTDSNFESTCIKGDPYLKYARITLDSCSDVSYFRKVLEGKEIHIRDVRLAAVNIGPGTKNELFKHYIISDIRYFGLALGLVLLVMMGYLKSPTLMLATICNVLFSMVLAYFIYFFILRMSYFPFMNLLALLILIAVGADDVFIFNDVWTQAQRELPNRSHEQWMSRALRHAASSISVTSLTTAGAFFSNLVSTITTIKCFAVFAGVCVLANLFLMLTWTPSMIVLVDKIWIHSIGKTPRIQVKLKNMSDILTSKSNKLFGKYIPKAVHKLRYLLILLFLGAGIAGCVLTFYKPGLHLPKSTYFQLFHLNQKMEQWDKYISIKFKDYQVYEKGKDIFATFTWGAKCEDNGDWLNPHDNGSLKFDPDFDMFDEESQKTLNSFTESVQNLPFMKSYVKGKSSMWDIIIKEGEKLCENPIIYASSNGCCKYLSFPFPKKHADCLKNLTMMDPSLLTKLYANYRYPVFDKDKNVKVVTLWVMTNLSYSYSFVEMKKNYKLLHDFYKEQKAKMPKGMKSICFSGEGTQFALYDIQLAIATGTLISTGVSVVISSIILFLMSLNVLLTIYATITISLAISATLGTIVLMGWELNFLEASVVSMAAGLSVDFTIHYCVAYRLSKFSDPKARVHESFHRVGFAVAVAALTTFLAGAATVPSHNISYVKLGIFLMLVILYSWSYATFFFQSVCSVCGPRDQFCQLQYPTKIFNKIYKQIKCKLCGL